MFNSLFGVLTKKNVFDKSASIFLDCGSVEWEIWIPKTALDRLPFPGEETRIFTYLYHHEDLMKIYGFLSPEDRSLFLDLLTVEGIGPSAALKIMSSMETNVFVKALEEDDITVLEKAAGKKTAQKLILKRILNWPGSSKNIKTTHALTRFYGNTPHPKLNLAYQQQGLLQIISDFCSKSDSCCGNCSFPCALELQQKS